MIRKGDMECDPRGLIYEAFRIEDITFEDCRAIFFDWALGVPQEQDTQSHLIALIARYDAPEHPMTAVLKEGLKAISDQPKRRGGRAARVPKG